MNMFAVNFEKINALGQCRSYTISMSSGEYENKRWYTRDHLTLELRLLAYKAIYGDSEKWQPESLETFIGFNNGSGFLVLDALSEIAYPEASLAFMLTKFPVETNMLAVAKAASRHAASYDLNKTLMFVTLIKFLEANPATANTTYRDMMNKMR